MDDVAASLTASLSASTSSTRSEQTKHKQMSSFGEYEGLCNVTGHTNISKSKVAQILLHKQTTPF